MSLFRRKRPPSAPLDMLESLRPGAESPAASVLTTQADADGVLQLALAEVARATADTAALLQASIDRLLGESREATAAARALSDPPPPPSSRR